MKKVAFYLLNEANSNTKSRDLYVSRLAEKAYQNKLNVYIYTASNEENQTFDIQLWTFRDTSFVPHKIYHPTLPLLPPLPAVLIGNVPPPHNYYQVLINLTVTVPDFFADFTHIIELVSGDETLKQIARAHYKYYQQQGYEVVTHGVGINTNQ